uniref:Uncharacterized protein n=1 Tax=Arundo donax TaxID=35708 RepID=A0A0A9CIJ0_ARUDO
MDILIITTRQVKECPAGIT